MSSIAPLTKAEEIKLLRQFVSSLPKESYLYDCLEPFIGVFEDSTISDLPCSVEQSLKDRVEWAEEARREQCKLHDLQKRSAQVQRELKANQTSFRNFAVSVEEAMECLSTCAYRSSRLVDDLEKDIDQV
jgi:hypothetical protein